MKHGGQRSEAFGFQEDLDGHTPRSLTCVCAVDVTQLSEAEAVASRRVDVAVHGYDRAAGGHLEHLAHLDVHFKVGDGAPELGSCNENRAGVCRVF